MYDEDRVKKRGAMSQYRAQFGMLYNKENGRLMDSNDRKDAVQDQVMRHNTNPALHNRHYANEKVRFDVQSAGLRRPSADGVLRMLTHMSLICDSRALVHVPKEVLAALPPNPVITALKQEREQLKAGAYRIQGTSIEAEVQRLPLQLSQLELKLFMSRVRYSHIVCLTYRTI
jgi:hypothetical protein